MNYDFQKLKASVSIRSVAEALGYTLNRRAGTAGRWVEYTLDKGGIRDTLIVSNDERGGSARFFRRDGSKGDVISLIRDNINSFNVTGVNEWDKIGKILLQHSTSPVVSADGGATAERPVVEFDPKRYETSPVNVVSVNSFLAARGFDVATVRFFSPFVVMVKDLQNERFNGSNIGFPYHLPLQGNKLCGYEIRGAKGFKSKAAGTNSSSGAWVANFAHLHSRHVDKVLFFESAFDAMACYQANRANMSFDNAVFVSLGGSFSDGQILAVMSRFPNAVPVECFDNDMAGRIFAVRMAGVLSAGQSPYISHNSADGKVTIGATTYSEEDVFDREFPRKWLAKGENTGTVIESFTAPAGYKDWNDVIKGVKQGESLTPSKYQRNANLQQKRKGMKV